MTVFEMRKIWVEIEQLRDKLHDIASRKGIRSPEAIRANQRLDNRLYEYNYLKN